VAPYAALMDLHVVAELVSRKLKLVVMYVVTAENTAVEVLVRVQTPSRVEIIVVNQGQYVVQI